MVFSGQPSHTFRENTVTGMYTEAESVCRQSSNAMRLFKPFIALDMRVVHMNIFSYYFTKTYVLGTHQKPNTRCDGYKSHKCVFVGIGKV